MVGRSRVRATRLRKVEDWPMAGTPLWCELCDRDPIKWTSVLDAAQHWALRIETCQQADGSVTVPAVLQPYLKTERLRA